MTTTGILILMSGFIGVAGIITIPICLYYYYKDKPIKPSKEIKIRELELFQKEKEYDIKNELLEKTLANNEIITQIRKDCFNKQSKEEIAIAKLEAKREALTEAFKITENNYKTIIDDKNNSIKTLTTLVEKLTEALSKNEKISIETK